MTLVAVSHLNDYLQHEEVETVLVHDRIPNRLVLQTKVRDRGDLGQG